jgi:hypothetical protein
MEILFAFARYLPGSDTTEGTRIFVLIFVDAVGGKPETNNDI